MRYADVLLMMAKHVLYKIAKILDIKDMIEKENLKNKINIFVNN